MCNRSLSSRIAEEAQLLAEEKWIIETINKIKKQRNGLQIERLQLEAMKAEIRATDKGQVPSNKKTPSQATQEINTVNLMQNSSTQSRNRIQFETPAVDNDWDMEGCNEEELNLSVSNPTLLSQVDSDCMNYGNEEEEEEEEDDDELYLDINMLMDAAKE